MNAECKMHNAQLEELGVVPRHGTTSERIIKNEQRTWHDAEDPIRNRG
jgi:hypothetical protein